MENEKQILVVGRDECFSIVSALASSMGFTFAQSNNSVKDGLILQIQATGYDFGVSANTLADYLISECDNFNLNNQTEFNYMDFLNACVSQHPQYKKGMATPFSGLVSLDANREAILQKAGTMEVGTYETIDNIKTAFEDLGKSLKAVSIRLGDLDIETPKTNQKWYNQFQNKRKRK